MSASEHRFSNGPHFDYAPRTRVVYGPGRIERLGALAAEAGAQRVLVCTDPGIRAAGHTDRGVESLRAAGLHVTVFDDIHPNPTTLDIDRGLKIARDESIDFLVGLGGGSSMDCAKGINFLYTNGGRMRDYVGVGKAQHPMLPMIAVPTTAGTGSEAQSFAVIGDPETHIKMACGDKKAACRVAILDPELTVSMPESVTAATGIDAISHALETFVTKSRNVISQMFARRSWGLLAENFPKVLADPRDQSARGAMLLGAHLAGAAIENSMLGATHALANPLTALHDTTHGLAVGVMLPHVIRHNASVVGELYGTLASDVGLCGHKDPQASHHLANFVSGLFRQAGCPMRLSEHGVSLAQIADLGRLAEQQWTAKFNPRPVDAAALEELYRCAM